MRFRLFPVAGSLALTALMFIIWLAAGLALAADEPQITVDPPQPPIGATPAFVLQAGHRGSVRTALFSPDGHTLAAVCFVNGVITLWDLVSGQLTKVLAGEARSVTTIAFSPDGRQLAAATGVDVVLWDIAAGKVVNRLHAHTDSVTSIVFTPDGKMLASGSNDNTVILWDLAAGRAEKTFTDQQGHITALTISADGLKLATGADDQTIFVRNLATGQVEKKLTAPSPGILSLAFSPDGHRLAAATGMFDVVKKHFDGGDVSLWDLAANKLERTMTGHDSKITALAFSPDGTALATGANDQALNIWNAATGDEQKPALIGSAVNVDWSRSATWSEGGALTVWDTKAGKTLASFLGIDAGANWFVSTPQGYYNCTSGAESLVVWQAGKYALTLEQLAAKFKRPDVLRKALAGADLSDLFTLDVTQLPPNIGFLAPAAGTETNEQTVEVHLQAAGSRPITRVELTLNGQPAPPDVAHALVVDHPKDSRANFTVSVPFSLVDPCLRIRAAAYDTNEIMGTPVELALFRAKPSDVTLYVLAVGVNDYKNLPVHLRYAAPDARCLVETCNNLLGQPYAAVTPALLTDDQVTAGAVRDALRAIQEHARDTDAVLIYLSGHSVRDKQGTLYFATCDVDLNDLANTALSWDELETLVRDIHAQHALVLADTSVTHDGPIQPMDNLPIRFLNKSRHPLLLATDVNEAAMSRADWGHSAFVKALLEGMAGKADTNPQDGAVTLQELVDYTKKRVAELSEDHQHPQLPQLPDADNPELCWVILPKMATVTPRVLTDLLQTGDVNVHMKDHLGRTLLHQAALAGRDDLVSLLLEHGADINVGDHAGMMPLHLAAAVGWRSVAELLMKHGAETTAEDKTGHTPLDLAMINNRGTVIDLLLPLVDPNAQDQNGMTPLHYAVKYGRREAVKLLLDKGARVTMVDKQGRTALHWAATLDDADIVDLLVAHHASLTAVDALGATPLHWAAANNLEEVATHLLAWLKEAHIDTKAVNAADKDGNTPLHYAALDHHEKMIDLLWANGAKMDTQNKIGATPLHLAIIRNLAEVAQRLLKNGADVNARDNDTHTPLHWAATMADPAMTILLLDHQATLNTHDKYGDTPLHVAAQFNRLAIVRLLVEKKAWLNEKNAEGKTPLDLAIQSKASDVVDYLRLHGGMHGGQA